MIVKKTLWIIEMTKQIQHHTGENVFDAVEVAEIYWKDLGRNNWSVEGAVNVLLEDPWG